MDPQEANLSGNYGESDIDETEHADPSRSRFSLLGPVWAFFGNPYFTLLSRLVLGGIFLLAGLTKLGDANTLASNIADYEMGIPLAAQNIMANVLPPLEIGLGVWILIGLFTRFAAGLAGALVVVFLIAMVQATFRGLIIDCGCVATGSHANPVGSGIVAALGPVGQFLTNEKVGVGSIIRDVIFLVMALHLIKVSTVFALDNLRRSRRAPDKAPDEEALWTED